LSVGHQAEVSAPMAGKSISTRSFIPHRVHVSVGVLAAVTVATATWLARSPAATLAHPSVDGSLSHRTSDRRDGGVPRSHVRRFDQGSRHYQDGVQAVRWTHISVVKPKPYLASVVTLTPVALWRPFRECRWRIWSKRKVLDRRCDGRDSLELRLRVRRHS
jgi:hypothetical protein